MFVFCVGLVAAAGFLFGQKHIHSHTHKYTSTALALTRIPRSKLTVSQSPHSHTQPHHTPWRWSVRKHCRTRRLQRCLAWQTASDWRQLPRFVSYSRNGSTRTVTKLSCCGRSQSGPSHKLRSLSMAFALPRTFVPLESAPRVACIRLYECVVRLGVKPAGAALKSNINFHLANSVETRKQQLSDFPGCSSVRLSMHWGPASCRPRICVRCACSARSALSTQASTLWRVFLLIIVAC